MSTTTEIKVDAPVLTLINIFTVEPGRQGDLVRMLERATEDVMRHRPGFVSANIHRGLDGSTVVNYAQWTSRTDFEAMLGDSAATEHMRAITEFAESRPGLYEVISVHSR